MTALPRLQPLARAVLRTQRDDRLVALAREGREQAFDEIVRRYRPGLVAFAAAYAPADRAEDVVQESLVRAWEALRRSSGEIRLRSWLYAIVRNRAINARRDARVHEPFPEDFDGVPQPPDVVLTNEELAATIAAVQALPEGQREALVRSSVEGHAHEQIAAAMGLSTGAVRQLIYRGRGTIRNGAGLLVPAPAVRTLLDLSAERAGIAGGTVAAGSLASTGGASIAGKAATMLAIGAAAAGSGIALEEALDGGGRGRAELATAATRSGSPADAEAAGSGVGGARSSEDSRREEGSDSRGDDDAKGEERGSSGPGSGGGSGEGPGGESEAGDDGPGGGGDDSGPGGGGDDGSDPGGDDDGAGASEPEEPATSGEGGGDDGVTDGGGTEGGEDPPTEEPLGEPTEDELTDGG
jgi:RNA polymerase sigma factor (sigma-70 family)